MDQLANNEQGVMQEIERLQEEREKYKSLYEKLEKEVNNLNEELEEMHTKHSGELKAVKNNLEFRKH
jgi:chromosome segregation ATPase